MQRRSAISPTIEEEAAAVAERPSTPTRHGGETMTDRYREATLAGHAGEGWLEPSGTDAGEHVLEGRWRAEGGEEAYADLRQKYLAREPVTFRAHDGTETDVVVASWFRDDHPGSLLIRSV